MGPNPRRPAGRLRLVPADPRLLPDRPDHPGRAAGHGDGRRCRRSRTGSSSSRGGDPMPDAASPTVSVLYFYRTKWGAHDEFVELFRKNHWPILREQIATGRHLAVEMWTPRFHGDGRADWDVLVSIMYRDWAAIEEHSDAEIAAAALPGPGDVQGRGGSAGSSCSRPTGTCRSARASCRRASRGRTPRPRSADNEPADRDPGGHRARAADHRADPDRARPPRPPRAPGRLHDRHPARGLARRRPAARRSPTRSTRRRTTSSPGATRR